MVSLLVKIFIGDKDVKDPAVRTQYGMLCGAAGIGFNILLFAGKFIAGLLSGAIAITADAFNNLSDAFSSIITLIGFKLSDAEPDTEHPFGHGRIEYIAGLIVSFIIIMMGYELIKSSIAKILNPALPDYSTLAFLILIASILVKIYMFLYNRKYSKVIDSPAMAATASDSLSDTVATSAILITSIIAKFTGIKLDGFCGLLVGLLIVIAGLKAMKETIDPLLGQAPDPEFVRSIEEIVMSYSVIQGIHDLIVHDYGPGRVFISLHAEVPSDGDVLELHDTIDVIEHDIRSQLKCGCVIHMDPIAVGDPEVDKLKASVKEMIKAIDEELTMHDFRVVKGPTHTNLIFDVVAPHKFKLNDEELHSEIERRIKELNPTFCLVLEIDKKMA